MHVGIAVQQQDGRDRAAAAAGTSKHRGRGQQQPPAVELLLSTVEAIEDSTAHHRILRKLI